LGVKRGPKKALKMTPKRPPKNTPKTPQKPPTGNPEIDKSYVIINRINFTPPLGGAVNQAKSPGKGSKIDKKGVQKGSKRGHK